jgi:hypothetical protein
MDSGLALRVRVRNCGQFTNDIPMALVGGYHLHSEVLMRRTKTKDKIVRVNSPKAQHRRSTVSLERELAPVVWVGWQIRRGEEYFGVVQRADGTVERTRLERDDLQAAADFVTAHRIGQAENCEG